MKDLFKRLIKFTQQKEDFFTECLAATLREDLLLSRMFLQKICGQEVEGVKIVDSHIDIETQYQYSGSRIDMVFKLDNKVNIGVENKLWSPEGVDQLLKYLKLPLNALCYITGYHSNISRDVKENPLYLKPADGRAHFMWQDFYEDVNMCVERESYHVLTYSFLELLVHFGFDPPHAEIGDLLDPDEDIAKNNRQNFAKLWRSTQKGFRERGWKSISRGSIAELYVQEGLAKHLNWAWLDPIWQRGSLRIRLNLHYGIVLYDIVKLLEILRNTHYPDMEVITTTARRGKKLMKVIDVLIPMRILFSGLSDAESIGQALSNYTLAVFDTVG